MIVCRCVKDADVDECRRHQMLLLRQLCLPKLCLLLHQVLHTTQRYKQCVQIADCVADEHHQLYKVITCILITISAFFRASTMTATNHDGHKLRRPKTYLSNDVVNLVIS